jgi:hypothetical protein
MHAKLDNITITNEIDNTAGTTVMTINLWRLSLAHEQADSIALRAPEVLSVVMTSPIVAGSAPGSTHVECANLGDVVISESGLVDLFHMLSMNLLRFPEKKAPSTPLPALRSPLSDPLTASSRTGATANLVPSPSASQEPFPKTPDQLVNVTTVAIKHFGVKGFRDGFMGKKGSDGRDTGTVFVISLDGFKYRMAGPSKQINWDALTIADASHADIFNCSTGEVAIDTSDNPSHMNVNLSFDLQRAALTDKWLDVYDFILNEKTNAAMAPMKGGPAKNDDTASSPRQISAPPTGDDSATPKPPGGTMKVQINVKSVTVPFLRPKCLTHEQLFEAQIRGLWLVYGTRAEGGFDIDMGLTGLKLEDSKRRVRMLSEGRRSGGTDQVFALQLANRPADFEQVIAIKVDRLLASIATPSLYALIAYSMDQDGTIAALTKMSTTREERQRQAAGATIPEVDTLSRKTSMKALQPPPKPTAARVNVMKLHVEWQQPTVCLPTSIDVANRLHDMALAKDVLADELDIGIVVDLGLLTADITLDPNEGTQYVKATMTKTIITGLMSETSLEVVYATNSKLGRTSIDTQLGKTTLAATPHAVEVLNGVLQGNLTLPAVQEGPTSEPAPKRAPPPASKHEDPSRDLSIPSPEKRDSRAVTPTAPPAGGGLEFTLHGDKIVLCCSTDDKFLFATYRVSDITVNRTRPGWPPRSAGSAPGRRMGDLERRRTKRSKRIRCRQRTR